MYIQGTLAWLALLFYGMMTSFFHTLYYSVNVLCIVTCHLSLPSSRTVKLLRTSSIREVGQGDSERYLF